MSVECADESKEPRSGAPGRHRHLPGTTPAGEPAAAALGPSDPASPPRPRQLRSPDQPQPALRRRLRAPRATPADPFLAGAGEGRRPDPPRLLAALAGGARALESAGL